MLTHGGARRVQDGLSLGIVHHHLLQALQILLRQLLPVSDELSQSAVHGVVWHDLDQLWEVVAVPFAADARQTWLKKKKNTQSHSVMSKAQAANLGNQNVNQWHALRVTAHVNEWQWMSHPTALPHQTTAGRADVLGEVIVPPVSIQPAL